MYSTDFRYSKEHEWVQVAGDIATIGITDHAQKQLGDIVYVELPNSGDAFEAHAEMGSLESVKAVAEFYTPCSGTVVEINDKLEDAPETVNGDPHGAGWLVKMKLSDPSELDGLLSAADYEAFLAQEE